MADVCGRALVDGGCQNETEDPHTCPFAVEINDDEETLCTCCDECTQGCANDI